MDYKQVNDHPARLLNAKAAEMFDLSKSDKRMEGRGYAYGTASVWLTAYETENDVTFVALDNETLREVVRAYKSLDVADTINATMDFENAVRDLLGLKGLDED